MRSIAIYNQKGGVGKTTTAINLSAGLSRINKRVLLIDLDPQGDVGFCHSSYTSYYLNHFILGYVELKECISNLGKNLDIIYSDYKMSDLEEQTAKNLNMIEVFRKKLSEIENYDYVILDCPPSIRLINKIALLSVHEIIIPTSTDVLGYNSLEKTVRTILSLNKTNHHNGLISLILPTMYDKRNNICREILLKIKREFTPLLVSVPIRINSKLKEAPKARMSIFSYAKHSTGAEDYGAFVNEVIKKERLYDSRYTEEEKIMALRVYYDNSHRKKEIELITHKHIINSQIVNNETGHRDIFETHRHNLGHT